ncbi:PASTA domain-containing protein [Kribbella antibiotica]|uniref:PASTA domain-containing protein n=1 Tax=Kribbella antibiotica TaxID=190195 RepID=A0A4R4ZP61_9ACTN|nr:PASTA domain-containing protein [Kribbella antibiotica]TDD59774.1 PASTA domain-containing protein [Kribbella antibiotica]
MNEAKLTELLEQVGDRTAVSPPPIDAMRSGATRRRRRRTAIWSAAGTAVAVAAVIGGSTVLTNNETTPFPQPPVAANPVPEGMRLVGLGHAAIAVPQDWPTNKLKCGTPTAATVIVDVGPQALCALPRGNVESIEIARMPVNPEKPGSTIEVKPNGTIDGVPAYRESVALTDAPLCGESVKIPSQKLWITAYAKDCEALDQMLDQFRIVDDQTGIPGFQNLELEFLGQGLETPQAMYEASLKAYGLVPTVVSKPAAGAPKGAVIEVSPVPGTMVPNGSTVTVTVAG